MALQNGCRIYSALDSICRTALPAHGEPSSSASVLLPTLREAPVPTSGFNLQLESPHNTVTSTAPSCPSSRNPGLPFKRRESLQDLIKHIYCLFRKKER